MRLRHDTRGGQMVLGLVGWVIRTFMDTIGRTWRIDVVHGEEVLTEVLRRGDPVILSFWHNRSVMAVPLLLRRLHRNGLDVTVMVSGSKDGDWATRALEGWDVNVVRGSATRGGREALWGSYRAVRRAGSSPVLIPDGPTGPVYRYKAGVLHLARLSGIAVLPMGFAASRYRAIRSWDRLMIPRLFSRIAVSVGEPQFVPRTMERGDLEAERDRQESLLLRLTALAEEAVGTAGPADVPLPLPTLPEAGRT